MRLLLALALCTSLSCARQEPTAPQPRVQSPAENNSSTQKPNIIVPTGTKVELALTSPVWSKTVQEGDNLYAVTAFPVAVDNQMAIPPGTYVQGTIDAVIKPTRKTNQAVFQIHFTKLIFANGYTVQLPDVNPSATATVYVRVSYASDILLDNGSQIEMTVQNPLVLDAGNVAIAAQRSIAPPIGSYQSATRCRPTPWTPGTPDTVIPGTPGTPGTPDTVIPGGPGMPPTVIPGTPATPGTPPTIIPGSPGIPGISCPGPPVVTSGPSGALDTHVEYLTIQGPVQVGGKTLAPGTYQIAWTGMEPTTQASINQKGKLVMSVKARVVVSEKKATDDEVGTHSNPDGSSSLQFLVFKGEDFQLYFD